MAEVTHLVQGRPRLGSYDLGPKPGWFAGQLPSLWAVHALPPAPPPGPGVLSSCQTALLWDQADHCQVLLADTTKTQPAGLSSTHPICQLRKGPALIPKPFPDIMFHCGCLLQRKHMSCGSSNCEERRGAEAGTGTGRGRERQRGRDREREEEKGSLCRAARALEAPGKELCPSREPGPPLLWQPEERLGSPGAQPGSCVHMRTNVVASELCSRRGSPPKVLSSKFAAGGKPQVAVCTPSGDRIHTAS